MKNDKFLRERFSKYLIENVTEGVIKTYLKSVRAENAFQNIKIRIIDFSTRNNI